MRAALASAGVAPAATWRTSTRTARRTAAERPYRGAGVAHGVRRRTRAGQLDEVDDRPHDGGGGQPRSAWPPCWRRPDELVPPTARPRRRPIPTSAFDCVPHRRARGVVAEHAISNSFGFGGQNVTLLFRRARLRPVAVTVTASWPPGSAAAAHAPPVSHRAAGAAPRPRGRRRGASALLDGVGRRSSRVSRLTLAATRLALADAGLDTDGGWPGRRHRAR